jgi:hypothetical protein
MFPHPRLLLIGDDPLLLQTRRMILGTRFAVEVSARPSEACQFLRTHAFDMIIVFTPADNWGQLVELALSEIPAPKFLAVTTRQGKMNHRNGLMRSSATEKALMPSSKCVRRCLG